MIQAQFNQYKQAAKVQLLKEYPQIEADIKTRKTEEARRLGRLI